MGWIRNKRDALEAIQKGRIVDELEDHMPPALVRHLIGISGPEYVRAHVRYEGAREIWWFDSGRLVAGETLIQAAASGRAAA